MKTKQKLESCDHKPRNAKNGPQSPGTRRCGVDSSRPCQHPKFELLTSRNSRNKVLCLENPRDGGAWWAAVYGVAQSQTRLKRLSSSNSSKVLLF